VLNVVNIAKGGSRLRRIAQPFSIRARIARTLSRI